MVNYYIYAKDYSGSTFRKQYYHSNGLETLNQFISDVNKKEKELQDAGVSPQESKIIYLHWGYECIEVDEETTRRTYLNQGGSSPDTNPLEIINWLKKNYDICNENNSIKILYIITYGLVDARCVDKCFEANSNMHYETVVFHAFNESENSVDLSVASSFFKSQCTVYCNNKLHDSIDISNEFDYEKINIDNFASEIDNLKSYIKLKYIKTFKQDFHALEEIKKLKKLRARLFDALSSGISTQKVNLETKDRGIFLREFVRTEWYKNLVPVTDTMDILTNKVSVEKTIATLINYIVSENKSYSFDALKFERSYNKPVEEEPIDDNVDFEAEQEIEFPDIILEDEKGIPVVILMNFDLLDKLIFHRNSSNAEILPASFSKFKSTMECPLFLVNDKDISDSIGYFYTFNVFKQFLENHTYTEPRTRRQFHGGLVLTDTEQFDKYNDYVLSATYFRSKKVNFNVGLFYYVLWKNCENKEWMDRNVVERFKKYTMRRISQTVCKIGLSSLPLDPEENTSLPTALWYCVELSSCIFKDDPVNFTHERLRMFSGVARYMIEILKYFNYDLNLNYIERRTDLISHVMTLKKIQGAKHKVYYLLKNIFKTVDGFLVSEIEKPFNLCKLNYLKLDHKKMLPDNVVEETIHLNDYVHLMNFVGDLDVGKANKYTCEICEKTFRPYFVVDKGKSFYTELVESTKKVLIINDNDKDAIRISFEPADSLEFDKTLSLYNLFIRCVSDLEKYPTFTEYVDYITKKKQFHEELVTIFPKNVYNDIKDVYDQYQKIVNNVDVTQFIKVTKSYVSRAERIKAEEKVKFNNDDEIQHLISSEESKVKLRKKS